LHSTLFTEPSPAGAKYAVSRLGHCVEDCRVPVMPLSKEAKKSIDAAMDGLGLLS
jgi:4-hydroxy-tetrahydrodipicolinate synthase